MNPPTLHEKVDVLIRDTVGETEHRDAIREIMLTALRLSENHVTEGDISIIHTALKEIRHGIKLFSPYRNVRKVTVFGSARTEPSDSIYRYSTIFSRKMSEKGFMSITGAGEGIMRAAQEGAGSGNSFGVNIQLPFEQSANEFIENDPKLMTFKYFFTRKLFFIREADAIALFPGGFGTHDEAFEILTLLQTGKSDPLPVVMIDEPGGDYWKRWQAYVKEALVARELVSPDDMHFFKVTDQTDEAVEEIAQFYRNYHSIRFLNKGMVIRLINPVEKQMLDQLNDQFSDIVASGRIVTSGPFLEEEDEPDSLAFHRIVFHFDRRHFGRLRQLIDVINRYVPETQKEAS